MTRILKKRGMGSGRVEEELEMTKKVWPKEEASKKWSIGELTAKKEADGDPPASQGIVVVVGGTKVALDR